jgi:membrane protein implicated in regulation of membrane protease activity
VVVQPVDSPGGRVKLGDSEWSARGGPAAVGDRVRIVDIDGNCLKVEAEHRLPPA